MRSLDRAVQEYFRREAAAMKTMRGAHHKAILRTLSEESGHSYEDLRSAVLDASAMGAN